MEATATVEHVALRPFPGGQHNYLARQEYEVLFGGQTGPGKTAMLVLDAAGLQYEFSPLKKKAVDIPSYRAVLFRRKTTHLAKLIDEGNKFYKPLGAVFVGHRKGDPGASYIFPYCPTCERICDEPTHNRVEGAKIFLCHLEEEKNKADHDGQEYQFVGFDELTHFCLAEGAETLTANGWKKLQDVTLSDKVLALTPEWKAQYEQVTGVYEFDYHGKIHKTRSRQIRYAVTPNHSMVVEGQTNKKWKFVKAEDLPTYPLYPFDHKWTGITPKAITFDTPKGRGHGRNSNNTESIDPVVLAEFMGWYFSEGSAYVQGKNRGSSSPCVSIRQTKFQPSLDSLMSRLPWRSCSDGDGGYKIFSRQLFDYLKPLGNVYTKRIPRWILDADEPMLSAFLTAFVAGDGWKNKAGGATIGLANEGLIDDLQEVCVKLGYRATRGEMKLRRGKYACWQLTIHSRKGGKLQHLPEMRYTEQYDGKVRCLSVEPSHTFLCRYQGRVFWTGNSITQYLYLQSRMRSTIPGLNTRVRATAMPVGAGVIWVKKRFRLDEPMVKRYYVSGDLDPVQNPRGIEVERHALNARSRMFVPGYLEENLAVDKEEYRSNVSQLGKKFVRAMLKNDWEAFSGDFFPDFDFTTELVDPFKIPKEWNLVLSIDPGWGGTCAATLLAQDFTKKVYLVGTYYGRGLRVPDNAAAIKKFWSENKWTDGREPELFPSGHDAWAKKDAKAIQADERTFSDIFYEYDMNLTKAIVDRYNGWGAMQALMPNNFFVFKRENEPFLDEFVSAETDEKDVHDIKGKGNDPSVVDHALDACRYGIQSLDPVTEVTQRTLEEDWQIAMRRQAEKEYVSFTADDDFRPGHFK
jgi:hypothetical protein